MTRWTQEEAVALCREIERACPEAGCHVALTGGTLYKDGPRKDLDLLFYRIRQVDEINMEKLWFILAKVGIHKRRGWGWCFKATYNGKPIDCFFPEGDGDDYPDGEEGDFVLSLEDVADLNKEAVL